MAVLCYSCRAQDNALHEAMDNDARLRKKFYEWRFGEYERVEPNEVLREMIYHPHQRSPREVWAMAEKFCDLAETSDTKAFFKRIIDKCRNKTIFG